MFQAPFRSACHFAIGLLVASMVMHTWLVMGLIVPVAVSGSSMEPTLRPGDRLSIDRTAFAFRAPRRWEIVVFRCPDRANELCVKRVFGLPGEVVTLRGDEMLINGRFVRNPQTEAPDDPQTPGGDNRTAIAPWPTPAVPPRATSWQLGPGEYFVVGDNRADSDDSRSWVPRGGLDAKLLIGKPLGIR